MAEFGCGPHPVTVIHNHWIKLSDGTKLAARLWMPFAKDDHPDCFNLAEEDVEALLAGSPGQSPPKVCPAILEYLPYFKDIMTFERDFTRHQWFASHGFVSVRVEMRGTGNSDGLYFGEYLLQEQEDCVEVISYLVNSKWSNGKVAMYGKSWGGFNGLQVAALRPKGLATVISLYSTDWRYGNDIHYFGDCILGDNMLSWANQMHMRVALPPNPKYCSNWIQMWKDRLERSSESWLREWLSHPTEDEFWKHASLKDRPEAIEIPVLIIGGLADGYTDGAFRMAATLNEQSRAIVGPWGHDWPDVSLPGPQIDFLNMCLSWLKLHMAVSSPQVEDITKWPRLQVFLQEAHPPEPLMKTMPGQWKSVQDWPRVFEQFQSALGDSFTRFYLADGKLEESAGSTGRCIPLKSHALQGLGAPAWLSWGDGDNVSPDQSISARLCTCWASAQLRSSLAICGYSKLQLRVAYDKDELASLAVSLLDFYNNQYTLITYGVRGICPGRASSQTASPDGSEAVEITLKPTTYLVPEGHRVVLGIGTTYFPMILPVPVTNEIKVLELGSTLTIQSPKMMPHFGFQPPKPLLEIDKRVNKAGGGRQRHLNLDLYTGEAKITQIAETEDALFPSVRLSRFRSDVDQFCIDVNTLDWRVTGDRKVRLTFHDEEAKISIRAKAAMVPAGKRFRLSQELTVLLNEEEFFAKRWEDEVERKCP